MNSESSSVVLSSNDKYTFTSPRLQNFSLPSPIVFYLLNQCISSKVFQKIQQTCKYFFAKKKVVIFDDMVSLKFEKFYYGTKNKDSQFLPTFQYWLIHSLKIWDKRINNMKNIYRCDLEKLFITQVNLTFKEVEFLLNGGKIKILRFWDCEIKYCDETAVTLEVIFEKCPNIERLSYWNKCEIFSTETFEKLYQLKLINKLEDLLLIIYKVNNKIDPKVFVRFLKKYVNAKGELSIFLKHNITEPELQNLRMSFKKIIGGYFRYFFFH